MGQTRGRHSFYVAMAWLPSKKSRCEKKLGRIPMASDLFSNRINRRAVIKTAVAAGVAQIASPFVITARAADAIKIGMVDPLTGAYAAVANKEVIGAKFAVEQINA